MEICNIMKHACRMHCIRYANDYGSETFATQRNTAAIVHYAVAKDSIRYAGSIQQLTLVDVISPTRHQENVNIRQQ